MEREHRFVPVATMEQLRRERIVVEVEGHEILVLLAGEKIFAVGNVCSHEQVWLDDGDLHVETCELQCPMHEGRFDLRTGAATCLPAEEPIPTYPVRVEGDEVLVGIPA